MNDETIQEFKREEKEFRPNCSNTPSNMFGGMFMILIGGVALLAFSGVEIFGRSPWILFALLPTFWIVAAAYNKYVTNGRQLDRQILAILLFGLMPFAYILFPILGLPINILWPMTMILIGLGIILFRDK